MNSESKRALLTRHACGWVLSMTCHLLGIGGAMYLFAQVEQPVFSKPFQWDVAIIEPEPPTPQPKVAPAPVPPKQSRMKPVQEPPQQARPVHETRAEPRQVEHFTPQEITASETKPVSTSRPSVRPLEQVVESVVAETATAYQTVQQVTPSVQTPTTGSRDVQQVSEPVQQVPELVQQTPAPVRRPNQPTVERVAMEAPATADAVETAVPTDRPTEAAVNQVEVETVSTPELVTANAVVQSTPAISQESMQPVEASVMQEIEPRAQVAAPIKRAPQAIETPATVERRSVSQRVVKFREMEADYGWLRDSIWSRIHALKRYPAQARANRWEGKVVVRAVIRADGTVADLAVVESSGKAVLDMDALAVMRQASPLTLKHPLGKPQVTILIPINYRLDG